MYLFTGVPLINGGTVHLQAAIGLSRALDLILTGRSLSAKEAFEWGIANRIVACGTGEKLFCKLVLNHFLNFCSMILQVWDKPSVWHHLL